MEKCGKYFNKEAFVFTGSALAGMAAWNGIRAVGSRLLANQLGKKMVSSQLGKAISARSLSGTTKATGDLAWRGAKKAGNLGWRGTKRVGGGLGNFAKTTAQEEYRSLSALTKGGPKGWLKYEKSQLSRNKPLSSAMRIGGYGLGISELAQGRPVEGIGYTISPLATEAAKAGKKLFSKGNKPIMAPKTPEELSRRMSTF